MRGCWVATMCVAFWLMCNQRWPVCHHPREGAAWKAAACGDCWAPLISWLAGCSLLPVYKDREPAGTIFVGAASCAMQIVATSFVGCWMLLALLAATWHCSTVLVYPMVGRLQEVLATLASKVIVLMEAAPHPVKLPSLPVLQVVRFPEALENALDELMPNRLTEYLYDLSDKFTGFYTECKVGLPVRAPAQLTTAFYRGL